MNRRAKMPVRNISSCIFIQFLKFCKSGQFGTFPKESNMPADMLVVLGTGGTIAGRSRDPLDNIGYRAAQVGVDGLAASVPALSAGGRVLTEQVAQIDSKDMGFGIWRMLAQRVAHFLARGDVQGIVVTHGTDTLEETAFFLEQVCRPVKPVVLTCAMRPATALLADGPQNLLDAACTARWPGATGVVVVCAGKIHAARDVQKVHPYRLDAFGSGDAGVLGYVEEGSLRLTRDWPFTQQGRAQAAPETIATGWNGGNLPDETQWPGVEVVMNYAAANGRVVRALVAQGVRGLVVAGTGNGSLHVDLEGALLEAQHAGVRVVRASRCAQGPVLAKPDDFLEDSQGLTPVKARIALMLDLIRQDVAYLGGNHAGRA
jgi:L-asparaginase